MVLRAAAKLGSLGAFGSNSCGWRALSCRLRAPAPFPHSPRARKTPHHAFACSYNDELQRVFAWIDDGDGSPLLTEHVKPLLFSEYLKSNAHHRRRCAAFALAHSRLISTSMLEET